MGFREETRAWLAENCPESMRVPGPVPSGGITVTNASADAQLWLERMAERGWTVPTWPKEYGGAGLGHDEYQILLEEMHRINAREPIGGHGVTMIGPALLEFGTEEQCLEHLPPIASGAIKWCQGYSEPGAGSDLASLQCRAVEDGDDYVINGSKIWTSGAAESDWIFCLVRTDPDASKHEGISFLIFDMKSPGVMITQIELISGPSDFCQTFFDDVRVPKRNLISKPGNGWTVGKRLLQYERTSIGGASGGRQKITTIDEYAKQYVGAADGRISDNAFRDEVLRINMDDAAYQFTVQRTAEEAATTKAPTFMANFFKYYGTEQNKKRTELQAALMGTQGYGWTGEEFSGAELATTRNWLRSRANSIEGGTSEVMLNIIAKRILGLPD